MPASERICFKVGKIVSIVESVMLLFPQTLNSIVDKSLQFFKLSTNSSTLYPEIPLKVSQTNPKYSKFYFCTNKTLINFINDLSVTSVASFNRK